MGSLYWQLETLSHLSSCRVDPKADFPQNCGRHSAKVHIITLIHRQLDVSFSPCLPIFCEWISFLIIIHTHQQKNPSIRGHSLKNVETFLAAKFECGTFRFFFFDAVSTTTIFYPSIPQYEDEKKTTTLSSLLLLLSSAKKLWYFMIRNHIPHITHYHTTTTQAHTKLPLTKKSKQTADISCCCILREGTAEVVSWHACLRHSWFEPLPPKVHTLPPSPSISLHLKWRPDDGLRNRQIDTKSSLFELFTSFSIIKLDFFIFILLIHEMKRYPRYHWSSSESLL